MVAIQTLHRTGKERFDEVLMPSSCVIDHVTSIHFFFGDCLDSFTSAARHRQAASSPETRLTSQTAR